MIIAVDFSDDVSLEGLAAIFRDEHRSAAKPDALVVIGVYPDLAVVGGPMVGVAHFLPGEAPVVRAKDSTLFILDDGIDDVWIRSVYIDADSAGDAFREAAGQFGPCSPAIDGLVEAAVGAAAVESVWGTASLVGGRVQGERALRINGDVGYPRVLINEKRSGPVTARIGRLVDSALLVWAPQVTDGSDIYCIGITRVDDHAADVL